MDVHHSKLRAASPTVEGPKARGVSATTAMPTSASSSRQQNPTGLGCCIVGRKSNMTHRLVVLPQKTNAPFVVRIKKVPREKHSRESYPTEESSTSVDHSTKSSLSTDWEDSDGLSEHDEYNSMAPCFGWCGRGVALMPNACFVCGRTNRTSLCIFLQHLEVRSCICKLSSLQEAVVLLCWSRI